MSINLTRYMLATGHMSLGLTRLIQGFIIYRDTIDTITYFSSVWIRVNMAKDYLYIATVSCTPRNSSECGPVFKLTIFYRIDVYR